MAKDREKSWLLSPTKNPRQPIMLRGIVWLAQLKWELVKINQAV